MLMITRFQQVILYAYGPYFGCKHQEITTCTELCQQDRNRDKENRSCHPLLRQLKGLRVEQILYLRDAVRAYKCMALHHRTY